MMVAGQGAGRGRARDRADRRLVWDLPLRLFHWLLVASLFLLWLTQRLGYEHLTEIPAAFNLDWMTIHMWLGYWMLGLLVFRLLWGLVGPRHARFHSFFPLPRRVLAYVKGAAKPAGHNPLGAMMVFLMLGLIGLQAVTGLFTTDDVFTSGPFNQVTWLSPETVAALSGLHHRLFNYILAAIAIHVLAIIIYAVAFRHNLVGPMIHGYKSGSHVPMEDAIASSHLLRAVVVIALSAAIVYAILSLAPPPAEVPLY